MKLEETILKRIKSGRQILFSSDDSCIFGLQMLIDSCSRRTVIAWALALAEETVSYLEEKYPDDRRAREALTLTRQWARGEIKMTVAKQAILACHARAKEITSAEDIAHYHAVGQACSTVHAKGHAIGYPVYDLTALLRKHSTANCQVLVDQKIAYYAEKLTALQQSDALLKAQPWADFICDE